MSVRAPEARECRANFQYRIAIKAKVKSKKVKVKRAWSSAFRRKTSIEHAGPPKGGTPNIAALTVLLRFCYKTRSRTAEKLWPCATVFRSSSIPTCRDSAVNPEQSGL